MGLMNMYHSGGTQGHLKTDPNEFTYSPDYLSAKRKPSLMLEDGSKEGEVKLNDVIIIDHSPIEFNLLRARALIKYNPALNTYLKGVPELIMIDRGEEYPRVFRAKRKFDLAELNGILEYSYSVSIITD